MQSGESPLPPHQSLPADGRAGLASRGFLCLLLTQTLGTLNDNMFRWLAVPVGTKLLGGTEQAGVAALSWGIFWFTLPYLLLPTHAGWLADRFCKRSVIVWCKAAEIVVMLLGMGAILSGSAACLFAVLFLMGAQAALFAPAKSGSIPEVLDISRLSTGNGLLAMVTIVAVRGVLEDPQAGRLRPQMVYRLLPDGVRNSALGAGRASRGSTPLGSSGDAPDRHDSVPCAASFPHPL